MRAWAGGSRPVRRVEIEIGTAEAHVESHTADAFGRVRCRRANAREEDVVHEDGATRAPLGVVERHVARLAVGRRQWHGHGRHATACRGDRARPKIVSRRACATRRADGSQRVDRTRERRQTRGIELLVLLTLVVRSGNEDEALTALDDRTVADQQIARFDNRRVAEDEIAQKQRGHGANGNRNSVGAARPSRTVPVRTIQAL